MRVQDGDDAGEVLVFGATHGLHEHPQALGHFEAVHASGEGLVLQLLLHALRLQAVRAGGTHQRTGHDEARDLVGGQEGLVQQVVVGHVPARVVGADGVGQVLVAALPQPGHDAPGVLLGPAVVVSVMQKAGQAEAFDVLPQAGSKISHHEFHRMGMRAEFFRWGPVAKQQPGFIAGEHRSVLREF